MKAQHLFILLFGSTLLFLSGCQKEELAVPNEIVDTQLEFREVGDCESVSLSYPAEVDQDEEFTVEALIECGRVAIFRGYVIVNDAPVYNGLTCESEDIQWELLTAHECYTDDASWTGSYSEAGTYVFRTQHQSADGNCDNFNPPGPGNPGDCDDFNGVNFCCIMVEVLAACPDCTEDETAWAAGDAYNEGGGNWATYTAYEGAENTVTLYAGQTFEAGTVHFSEPDNGMVTITITLEDCWAFDDVSENVKIQDYAEAPSGNPVPGLFDHKATADSNPYSITVPENNYYGVHVDVLRPVECEEED